jgi:hypothetical protein
VDGALISRPDALVKGTVSNAHGLETGVTVNGMPAMVYGNQFVANHVPLDIGENRICVRASDAAGNTAEETLAVSSDAVETLLTLSPRIVVGLAPFETTLALRSALGPDHISLSDTGPAPLVYEPGQDANERVVRAGQPGVYTVHAWEDYTGACADSVAIAVFDRDDLDDLLRERWEHLRSALQEGRIEDALQDIAPAQVDAYRRVFDALDPGERAEIAGEMQDIRLIGMLEGSVEYDVRTVRGGQECSFLLLFEMDGDGFWKITFF